MNNSIVPVTPEQFAIEEVKRLVNIVVGLKNTVFEPGIDFGVIPGTGDKPVLLQPGMEKLLKALHLRAEYVERSKIEDFDKPLIYYRYECRLVDWETGICVGTAIGSANSHEKKWRWRNAERICPVCGKPAIIKGKAEYGGGWVCFDKKGGCKTKFKDGDSSIEDQIVGQIENPDIMDQMNTIDKIAQKRSLGSAIKTVANVSMLYTVDLEDFTPYETSGVVTSTAIEVTREAPTESHVATERPQTPATTGAASSAASTAPGNSSDGSAERFPQLKDFPPDENWDGMGIKLDDERPPNSYRATEVKVVPQGKSHMYLLKTQENNIALFGGDLFRKIGIKPDYWKDNPGKWFALKPNLIVIADQDDDKWVVHEIKEAGE